MEHTSRIAQLYGYTVCLVSLVTILFTVPSMVDNLFGLRQPLYSTDQFPGFAPTLRHSTPTRPHTSVLGLASGAIRLLGCT